VEIDLAEQLSVISTLIADTIPMTRILYIEIKIRFSLVNKR